MADKQKFLAKAARSFISRLIAPRCLGADEKPNGQLAVEGRCPDGKPEYQATLDLHVGLVTSSLGGFGGDAGGDKTDGLRLLAAPAGVKSADGVLKFKVGATEADTFANLNEFSDGVAKLVTAAGETGAGFEAQLESMYRFLVQPDPWASVAKGGELVGIDNVVLRQRKAFLRPDSAVLVLMLSDEDDSSVDPATVNGSGSAYMSSDFPRQGKYPDDWPDATKAGKPLEAFGARDSKQGTGRTAARGASACESVATINSAACNTCAFQYLNSCGNIFGSGAAGASACAALRADNNCQNNGGYYGATEDPPNVRFHQMKRRFGVDPQYPIARYVRGLQADTVPRRAGEHDAESKYTGTDPTKSCTNPLFAASLPESASYDANGSPIAPETWCNLPKGNRDPRRVLFAMIGGAPTDLVAPKVDPAGNLRPLNEAEWTPLVGTDPVKYNYGGQDPRMVQSRSPRKDGNGGTLAGDWDTDSLPLTDLQYACTFALPNEFHRDASKGSGDCVPGSKSPVCQGPTQVKAKAFPTIRQFSLAKQLGVQGIAGSLCAVNIDPAKEGTGEYGYEPVLGAVAQRLKPVLQ
jgi:hypothetical protein